MLYIGPFLYLSMMVLLRSIGPVEAPAIERNRADRRRPLGLFVAMAVFIILSGAAEATGDTYFNVYMDDALRVSPALIGAVIAMTHLLSVPATLAAPLLVARWQSSGAIVVTGLGIVAGSILLAVAAWWIGAAAGFILLMTMASVLFPIRTVYHQEATAPVWRSAMSGVVTLSMQLGRAAIVIVGGFLVARVRIHGYVCGRGIVDACRNALFPVLLGQRLVTT